MPRESRTLDRMTRRELLDEIRRLRGASTERHDLQKAVFELRTLQEQLARQRDDLVEAQRQLAHSRDIYADLYDYAPLPYVTLDEYGVLRNINITGAELFGRGRMSLDGVPFSALVEEPDRRRFLEHMRRCRQGSGPVTSDLTLLVAGRQLVPVRITTRASVPPGSASVEYRTAIVDLRMLRTVEAARARAELERARIMREDQRLRDAMEAKDEFLAVLSHELRTPLTPILAVASALHDRADVPATLREDLARIKRNVELETRLIDDLLDMTRAARGALSLNREIVDVHDVLRQTVELCEPDRPRGIALVWALAAGEHHVRADPVRLRQVFWNLVRNAFQSIAGDGEILFRSTNDGPGRVTIAVSDSGCGIEAADLELIFLPFYQPLGEVRGRLGLGLAISKSLVDAHGGRLAVTSEGRGRGACFEIELGTTPVSAREREPAAADPGQGLVILLVEDNADSADALSLALQLEGLQVRVADSLAAAREAAREPFDVLVSDLALPDGSGLDLVAELRGRTAAPAIALSGYGSTRDRTRTAAAGFSAHLTKPVTVERLSETIRGVASAAARPPGQPA